MLANIKNTRDQIRSPGYAIDRALPGKVTGLKTSSETRLLIQPHPFACLGLFEALLQQMTRDACIQVIGDQFGQRFGLELFIVATELTHH